MFCARTKTVNSASVYQVSGAQWRSRSRNAWRAERDSTGHSRTGSGRSVETAARSFQRALSIHARASIAHCDQPSACNHASIGSATGRKAPRSSRWSQPCSNASVSSRTLACGSRIQAVFSPVTTGPSVSICNTANSVTRSSANSSLPGSWQAGGSTDTGGTISNGAGAGM